MSSRKLKKSEIIFEDKKAWSKGNAINIATNIDK